jgi:hypothetical protein
MFVIENELIFVSVPKNASMAVHYALEESTINFEPAFNYSELITKINSHSPNFIHQFSNKNHKIKIHMHYTTADMYSMLNKKLPTIFIKRDYSERFISALNYIFNFRLPLAYPELKNILHNIDNDWIYKNINKDDITNIKIFNPSEDKIYIDGKIDSPQDLVHRNIINSLNKFLKNKIKLKNTMVQINEPFPKNKHINFKMLDSQEIWKSGHNPKHIFDIKELNKLEEFIENKYEKEFKIKNINTSADIDIRTNFVNDTKLRNWVWDNFEKHHFIKRIF